MNPLHGIFLQLYVEQRRRSQHKRRRQKRTTALTTAMAYIIDVERAFAKMDLNDHDASGHTPLHVAVRSGDASWVRDLLTSGADPNVRDTANTGLTPFAMAFRMARPDVIAAFLEDWRCDWEKQDAAGLTAVHHAAASGMLMFKNVNCTPAEPEWICR